MRPPAQIQSSLYYNYGNELACKCIIIRRGQNINPPQGSIDIAKITKSLGGKREKDPDSTKVGKIKGENNQKMTLQDQDSVPSSDSDIEPELPVATQFNLEENMYGNDYLRMLCWDFTSGSYVG